MSSQNVTLFQQETGAVRSARFNAMVDAGIGGDLGEGIRGSYGILTIKGGRFSIKYKGQTHVIMAPPTQPGAPASPVSFIDVVIVKANPFLNKQWYKGNYVEGSTEQPDCYSLDGQVPSPAAKAPQSQTCALCPKNQWGSKIGDNGQKQKACRDTKKLAVVPLTDIRNAGLGGALLFRVPATSLKELSIMADALKGRGYPYNSVGVRITFDTTVSHPKPLFQALRPLNDAEADQVVEMYSADSTDRVLADNDVSVEEPELPPSAQFAQPQPVAMPHSAQVATATPIPQPPPAPVATAPMAAPVASPAPQIAPLPPGMIPAGAVAIQPFSPNAAPPPPNAFVLPATALLPGALQLTPETPVEAATPAKPARTRRAPVTPVATPATLQLALEQPAATAEIAAEPASSQLNDDIGRILEGLGSFQSK